MIEVGRTYGYGRDLDDRADLIFVVLRPEAYVPPRPPTGYIPGPGFRILVLGGEIRNALHGPTKAGEEALVAESSAIACDARPMEWYLAEVGSF